MSAYAAGKRVEDAVRDDLRDHGYWTISARSSKGASDIVAVGYGEVLFVSVKRSNPVISPAERAAVIGLADRLATFGLPIVACKPPRKAITYRLLTGPGPKDWVPWWPEQVGVAA